MMKMMNSVFGPIPRNLYLYLSLKSFTACCLPLWLWVVCCHMLMELN